MLNIKECSSVSTNMFRWMCTTWYRLTEFDVSVRPIVLGEKISYFWRIIYSANMSSINLIWIQPSDFYYWIEPESLWMNFHFIQSGRIMMEMLETTKESLQGIGSRYANTKEKVIQLKMWCQLIYSKIDLFLAKPSKTNFEDAKRTHSGLI